MSTGFLLAKFAIGGVVASTAITPTVFYFAPPWSVELTQEKFNEFKKSNSFESCLTFLSNDDKKHLLFLCIRKNGEQQTNNTVHHYFYNGGTWEVALSLEKDPNNQSAGFFLVRTQTWLGQRRRRINNDDNVKPGKNNLTAHNESGMQCNFQTFSTTSNTLLNKNFACFSNLEQHKLQWQLKEITFN